MLLIADLDGTAIDSEPLILASCEHVIQQHGLLVRPRVELKKCIGITLKELYTQWSSESECECLCTTHREFQAKNTHLVKVIPGISEVFSELRNRKVKIAINTNRSSSTTEFLELTGLTPLVDYVVCCNDVTKPKPHPEGIHKILHYFGMAEKDAWMLGDTPVDIQAGKSAGISTIGAHFLEGEHLLSDCTPDYFITSPIQLLSIIK
jgi:pyrophosphatase PpaX